MGGRRTHTLSRGIGCIPARDLLHLQSHCSCVRRMCKHRCCCSPELSLPACFLKLAITRRVNLGLSPSEHFVRRHMANGDLAICTGQKLVGDIKTSSVMEVWRNRPHW